MVTLTQHSKNPPTHTKPTASHTLPTLRKTSLCSPSKSCSARSQRGNYPVLAFLGVQAPTFFLLYFRASSGQSSAFQDIGQRPHLTCSLSRHADNMKPSHDYSAMRSQDYCIASAGYALIASPSGACQDLARPLPLSEPCGVWGSCAEPLGSRGICQRLHYAYMYAAQILDHGLMKQVLKQKLKNIQSMTTRYQDYPTASTE